MSNYLNIKLTDIIVIPVTTSYLTTTRHLTEF